VSVRVAVDAAEVQRAAAESASGLLPSNRELVRELAIQVQRAARQNANGAAQGQVRARRGKLPGAGNYPIPVRTGTFGRGFGLRVTGESAIVFNDTRYARALHDGFRPYGNPNATPIPARPYFDDAPDASDIDAAHAAWERRMQRAGR